MAVKAVDPATAASTSSIFASLKPNPVSQLQPGEVLIGQEMAKNLDLRMGDTVAISFMRLDLGLSGLQPKVMGFKVAGIFKSQIAEYDKGWAFIHIADSQSVAGSQEAEYVEVRTRSVDAIDRVKTEALGRLNQEHRRGFMAQDLRDTNKPLFEALRFEKVIFACLLSLIVVIAATNIISSLGMLVIEKRRDLGVLLSLGASPLNVRRIFILHGIRIGAVGTLVGLGISVPACIVLDLTHFFRLPKSLYDFITYIPFRVHVLDLIIIAVFPVLVAWLAAWYPARRAAAVDPVDALRAE
jgi:lipoprotein-releasing system permease protein